MRTDPFLDTLLFLIGYDADYKPLGIGQYPLIVFFDLLVAANLALVAINWRDDPTQRKARHVSIWIARSLIAGMWFQGSLWKLPLPAAGGFKYWLNQSGLKASWPWLMALYHSVLIPHIGTIAFIAVVAEIGFAISFMLGFACRLAGVIAALYTVNLWLSLYHKASEWPWTYMFLILLMVFFAIDAVGRSLGLDAWLHRQPAVAFGRSLAARVYRMVS